MSSLYLPSDLLYNVDCRMHLSRGAENHGVSGSFLCFTCQSILGRLISLIKSPAKLSEEIYRRLLVLNLTTSVSTANISVDDLVVPLNRVPCGKPFVVLNRASISLSISDKVIVINRRPAAAVGILQDTVYFINFIFIDKIFKHSLQSKHLYIFSATDLQPHALNAPIHTVLCIYLFLSVQHINVVVLVLRTFL